jgi:hypothetical protein
VSVSDGEQFAATRRRREWELWRVGVVGRGGVVAGKVAVVCINVDAFECQ